MLAGGFIAFLSVPASATLASGSPMLRAGDACKKVGRRRTVGGKTFECVQKAGGRQWQRVKTTSRPQAPSTNDVKVLDSTALAVGASQNVVVTSGGRNYAIVVSRTSSGLVAFNRACTHQGTLVTVNSANQLYCISHGSRFNLATGEVIEGPAGRPLTKYKVSERSGAIYITI
jgi:nitrite reductase/ring-hydroxylating ferredoxin subunit